MKMTTRAAAKNKNKKPLQTALGKAPACVDNEQIDLSHVGKTIHTSLFGLKQVLNLYETATEEVQSYITYECDIMYECRICRTIFRSLANFILHKRNYCQESYKRRSHSVYDKHLQSEFLIVNDENLHENDKVIGKEDKELASSSKCSSLSTILPRLLDKQKNALTTQEGLVDDNSDEIQSSNTGIKPNIALQSVNDSKTCVFQTMFETKAKKLDFMKTEVMEIHDILENNEAIIGENGKIVVPEGEKNDVLKNNFMCVICNQKFSTKKTLTYHINYKHNGSRKVYQCTECTDKFANTWGVFRHLYKIHRKTPAQVKKLRDKIHSNKITNDEHIAIKNNVVTSDVKVLNNNVIKSDSDDQQWIDDLECDNDLQRCGGCGRKFERKAALHSHAQFCTKRIALCNSIKENTNKKLQEEKQDKLNKPSKVETVYYPIEGSRKRKPQKILRYDYTKEVCDVTIKNEFIDHSKEIVHNKDCADSNIHNNENAESNTDIEVPSRTIADDEIPSINSETSESIEKIAITDPPVVENNENVQISNCDEGVNLSAEKIQIYSDNNNSESNANKKSEDNVNTSSKKRCKESHALDIKCIKYVNKEKNKCLPCNKMFKSHKSLMRHMAIHFNWYRYQCKNCEYMSYQRSKCEHHIEKKHSITDKTMFNNYIIHLTHKKIVQLSTNFMHYAKCKTEIKCETQGEILKNSDAEETPTSCADSQGRSVRDMIMEVIFGSNVGTSNSNDDSSEATTEVPSMEAGIESAKRSKLEEITTEQNIETSPKSDEIYNDVDTKSVVAKDRPVRNRTATVRKDFLYDMTQILKSKPNKNKDESVDCAAKQKPLRVYTRKPKLGMQQKGNVDKNLKLIDDVSLNNKTLQVTNNIQNVFTM